jgi:hypothetical protein
MIGGAKQTGDAHGAIHDELTDFLPRANEPALQHVVPEPDRKVKVIEKVGKTGANRVRHNAFVSLGQGFDRMDRHRVVDPECGVIDAFIRIIYFLHRFIAELIP